MEGSEGLRGNKVCRITAAGLKHPPTRSICASAAEGFENFYTLREAQIIIENWRRHYKCASQHPSVYVIEENRLC